MLVVYDVLQLLQLLFCFQLFVAGYGYDGHWVKGLVTAGRLFLLRVLLNFRYLEVVIVVFLRLPCFLLCVAAAAMYVFFIW